MSGSNGTSQVPEEPSRACPGLRPRWGRMRLAAAAAQRCCLPRL